MEGNWGLADGSGISIGVRDVNTLAILKGQTFDGIPIIGQDGVKIK